MFNNQTCTGMFTDSDGDTVTVTVDQSTVPAGLTIVGGANQVTINGTPTGAQPWTFTVTGDDGNGGSSTCTITLICDTPEGPDCSGLPNMITCSGLPFTVSVPQATTLAATFSGTGYSFDPATGQITGTSTLSQTVTVMASNSGGTCNHVITIAPCDNNQGGTQQFNCVIGEDCDIDTTTCFSGGTGPFTYTPDPSTPLPSGLSIVPSTGQISGQPNLAAITTFNIIRVDANGIAVTCAITVSVTGGGTNDLQLDCEPQIAIVHTIDSGGNVSTNPVGPYSIVITGGTAPYTLSASGVFIASFVDLGNGNYDWTFGSQAGGPENYVITVTDANGNTADCDAGTVQIVNNSGGGGPIN